MRRQRKKKRYVGRRKDEEGERGSARNLTTTIRASKKETIERDAHALYQPVSFPVPFFSPTSSNSAGSYAAREGHQGKAGRKREREKKEGTSLAPLEKHRGE